MRLLGKRVLIAQIETEERAPGSLIYRTPDYIADATQDQAEVVAVAPLCEQGLREGDWVLIRRWAKGEAPRQLQIEGRPCWLITEDDVLATLSVR